MRTCLTKPVGDGAGTDAGSAGECDGEDGETHVCLLGLATGGWRCEIGGERDSGRGYIA